MAKTTKYNIDLTPEDKKILDALKSKMARLQGSATWATVIRSAIRQAAAK